MKNIIILGSGRSGTSLLAGMFSRSGYHMGDNLIPPRETNPKGFFESNEINFINEEILGLSIPKRRRILFFELHRQRPKEGQRWLAQLPIEEELKQTVDIVERIKVEVGKTPFCYKDPRFSYTLPVWLPFLKNTVFLVAFRHPSSTVKSILKECSAMKYLEDLDMTEESAMNVWFLMYSHILNQYDRGVNFIFFHYSQLLNGGSTETLRNITRAKIFKEFSDSNLERNKPSNITNTKVMYVYNRLCKLASYRG